MKKKAQRTVTIVTIGRDYNQAFGTRKRGMAYAEAYAAEHGYEKTNESAWERMIEWETPGEHETDGLSIRTIELN